MTEDKSPLTIRCSQQLPLARMRISVTPLSHAAMREKIFSRHHIKSRWKEGHSYKQEIKNHHESANNQQIRAIINRPWLPYIGISAYMRGIRAALFVALLRVTNSVKGFGSTSRRKPVHAPRRAIIREWRSLPRDKRQTVEQAAPFSAKAIETHRFHCCGDRYQKVLAWQWSRTGKV